MKERENYKLPAEVWNDGKPERPSLPDYVTIRWYSDIIGDFCEVEVDPNRAIDFMIRQEKIEGKELEWQI